jgi:hypothetical protein
MRPFRKQQLSREGLLRQKHTNARAHTARWTCHVSFDKEKKPAARAAWRQLKTGSGAPSRARRCAATREARGPSAPWQTGGRGGGLRSAPRRGGASVCPPGTRTPWHCTHAALWRARRARRRRRRRDPGSRARWGGRKDRSESVFDRSLRWRMWQFNPQGHAVERGRNGCGGLEHRWVHGRRRHQCAVQVSICRRDFVRLHLCAHC